MDIPFIIAQAMGIPAARVAATMQLLDDGATIPFVARYRKEVTGGLDELAIQDIGLRAERLRALDKRKQYVAKTIAAAGAMTPQLQAQIDELLDADALEDLFAPWRPRRQTRATRARELGLEPLARILVEGTDVRAPEIIAIPYVNEDVATVENAVSGACDILAEWTADDPTLRNRLRNALQQHGYICTRVVKGHEEEAAKYRSYFDFRRPIKGIPSHNFLAIKRAEREGLLKVWLELSDLDPETWLKQGLKGSDVVRQCVLEARTDGYKRLLRPAMDSDVTARTKEQADKKAIEIFAQNLRQLLLAAPLGRCRVMGIDPGQRTGCKVVCLDQQGNLIDHDVIFPHPPQKDVAGATQTVKMLVKMYKVQAIAVGNGTGGRETMTFLSRIGLPKEVKVYNVNESGASVYSASALAREEFPDEDITVRGAVSIGRRLIDPLAELVKIDPQSIGVGQYQHDVDQKALKEALDFVVMQCVNLVGVDLNTASYRLLSYVSGLGPAMAKTITQYRAEHGDFSARVELLQVPRLGAKTYEQCAGFLRIPGAENPLDNTAVHPEDYELVTRMAADLGCDIASLAGNAELIGRIDPQRYVTDTVGLPTINDILDELRRPGRDPRAEVEEFEFAPDIHEIEDVREGMTLPGIVTNITDFGAFVNIGVHQDGLVHRSQLPRRAANVGDVLHIGQKVEARVISVDLQRRRIGLSLKGQG